MQEGTSTFLNLLVQEQGIRNQRDNVKTLDQSYRLHEALLAAGVVSGVQVDQVFQQLQQGRATLIQREAQLETSLDLYKISLGLPPSLNAKIDDALLKQFELASPEVMNLQKDIEKLQATYRELDQPPTRVMLEDAFKRLQSFQAQTVALAAALQGEIQRWRTRRPPLTKTRRRCNESVLPRNRKFGIWRIPRRTSSDWAKR